MSAGCRRARSDRRTPDLLGHARDRDRSRAPCSRSRSPPTSTPDRVCPPGRRTASRRRSCGGARSTPSILSGQPVPNELATTRRRTRRSARRPHLDGRVPRVRASRFNVVRVYEFRHLNVSWDHDAYGSIVWMPAWSAYDAHRHRLPRQRRADRTHVHWTVEEHRFVDVEENAVYWYFVVLAWLPIYGVIYWAPRLT